MGLESVWRRMIALAIAAGMRRASWIFQLGFQLHLHSLLLPAAVA